MLIDNIIIDFFISFFLNGGIIFYLSNGGKIGLDESSADGKSGPQKFHVKPTARIGGSAIFIAFFIVMAIEWVITKKPAYIYLAVSTLPIFMGGIADDVTRKVSPRIRLAAALVSAFLAVYFLNAIITRTDIGFIDGLLSIKIAAVIFTVFALTGVSNSFNIIDGYNGLSSVVSILILFSLGYVSFELGDAFLVNVCLILAFAILGFLIWNYPFGKIFLGDGGAYLIGLVIAVVSVLLVDRHKNISPWFPLLLCIYPIFETLFSMNRRRIKKNSPLEADAFHLHTLIYKRLVPHILGANIKGNQLARNYSTSPFLWLLVASFSIIPALLFRDNTFVLIIFVLLFISVYIWLYKSIADFKLCRFLRNKKS